MFLVFRFGMRYLCQVPTWLLSPGSPQNCRANWSGCFWTFCSGMFTGSGCFPTLMLYAAHPASRFKVTKLTVFTMLFFSSTEITCCPPSEVIRWEDLILQCPQDTWNFFCRFSLWEQSQNKVHKIHHKYWNLIYMPLYDTESVGFLDLCTVSTVTSVIV